MAASLFGVFTASLAVICFLCALPALRKNRYALAMVFILNAIAHAVTSIHFLIGNLF